MLKFELPWDSQPQEVAQAADWLPPGSLIYTPTTGIVGTDPLALLGTPVTVDPAVFASGRGVVGSATSSRLPMGSLARASPDVGHTLVAQFLLGTTATRYVAGSVGTDTAEIEDFGINLNSAEANSAGRTLYFFRRSSGGTAALAGSTDAVVTNNAVNTVVWIWRGAGTFELFVNGVSCAVTVAASTFTSADSGAMEFPLTLLNRNVRNTFGNGGGGLSVGLFARIPIGVNNGQQISADPWGTLFASRSIWIPVSAGGGGISGTLATTNANDTSAASGTTTVLGTLARTNASDTSAASGTTTVLGASAVTNADDTSAASGTVGTNGTTGTVAVTNANDTAVASGTTTVVGTVARTNADDSASAAGWVGTITGTANVTNGDDTSDASGVAETGIVEQDNSGGWPIYRRKKKKDDEEELEPAVIEAVAVVPAPRRMVTLEKLIGKKAAAQVNEAQLSSAIRMLKRKRQDEELLLM